MRFLIAHVAAARRAAPYLAFAAVLVLVAACTREPLPPTPTAITLPPTPTAITMPTPVQMVFPATPTAITLPPTPTAITLPPTPTAITLPPTPTAITMPMPVVPVEPKLSTADIVEMVSPAVVHIQVESAQGQGSGTGVILNSEGLILTNAHVVRGAFRIGVSMIDDRVFEGRVVGADPSVDIALVSVEAEGLTPAVLGDSSALRVGEDVVAIGHALGLPGGPTVSKGVVSALGRSLGEGTSDSLTDLIQTDAAINPGNSGGPLINDRGEVIGINTAKIDAGEGIGFAIEINTAQEVAERLLHETTLRPGFLGISGINITPALAQLAQLPVSRGVGVVALMPGGPAERGGVLVDDIIVGMGEEQIDTLTDMSRFLLRHGAGETVAVGVVRGERPVRLNITLGEPPE